MKHRSIISRRGARDLSLALLALILTPPLFAHPPTFYRHDPVPVGHGAPSAVRYQPAVTRHAFRHPRAFYRSYISPIYYDHGRAPYVWGSPTIRRFEPAPAPQQPPIIIIQQPAPAQPAAAPAPAAPAVATPPPPARNPNALDRPQSEPGAVYLWIEQPEAVVHLDGEYLGTGGDVAGLDSPLELPAGVHVLEVQHPDYGAERLVFAVPSADEVLVEINLSGDRRGRKARLRTAYEVEARLRVLQR